MKTLKLLTICMCILLSSCSTTNEEPIDNNQSEDILEDVQLSIEFMDGPLKGKHIFTEIENKIDSDMNGELFDGNTNFEFKNIINENNLILNNFRRSIKGDLQIGSMESKEFSNGCGSLFLRDDQNIFNYKEISANFTGCSLTEVLQIGLWKKEVAYEKRKVKISFNENIEMKIINDDNSTSELTTSIKVTFIAEQKNLIL
jgi:hypothetical protein